MDILALLLDDPHVDLHIKNDSGFNVLHLAAMNGNILATETIVSEAPELAGVTDKGGYTSLHLAAMNGHYQVVTILLNQGDCMVDDLSSCQRSALWLAVSEGHVDITEFLVENGADVNKPDNNGNSPMHMSLLNRSKVQYHAIHASTTPCIAAIFDHLLQFPKPGMDTSLAVAWFLARCGGDLHQMNDAGITPLQMANNIGEQVEESLLIWKTSISDGVDFGRSIETGRASGAGASENGPMNRSGAQSETGMAKRLRSILREMRSKCQEMEDINVCALCCEKPRDVAFTCGHRVCADCAKALTMCPWCRQIISRRITLY
ncbi:E3 ubiquitin-protein ligase MIB2-like [Haemaphysalis longicornis]